MWVFFVKKKSLHMWTNAPITYCKTWTKSTCPTGNLLSLLISFSCFYIRLLFDGDPALCVKQSIAAAVLFLL